MIARIIMIRRMLGLILLSRLEVAGGDGGERNSNGESRGGGEIEGSNFPISPGFLVFPPRTLKENGEKWRKDRRFTGNLEIQVNWVFEEKDRERRRRRRRRW